MVLLMGLLAIPVDFDLFKTVQSRLIDCACWHVYRVGLSMRAPLAGEFSPAQIARKSGSEKNKANLRDLEAATGL